MTIQECSCQYDGCDEHFETGEDQTASQKRLAHSLREHWGIDPAKYRTLTGEKYF